MASSRASGGAERGGSRGGQLDLLAKAAETPLPGTGVVHSKRLTPQRRVNSIEDVLSMDITDIGTAFPACAGCDEIRRQALMHGKAACSCPFPWALPVVVHT